MKKARVLMIVVGMASLVMAGYGFWFNSTTIFTDFSDRAQDQETAYFYSVFYVMSGICIVCYVALLVCGVQFVRLRTGWVKLFLGVIIFEFVYFFMIEAMWLPPTIKKSVAAAIGVANGGMSFQTLSLFIFWAPFLALWAARKLKGTNKDRHL